MTKSLDWGHAKSISSSNERKKILMCLVEWCLSNLSHLQFLRLEDDFTRSLQKTLSRSRQGRGTLPVEEAHYPREKWLLLFTGWGIYLCLSSVSLRHFWLQLEHTSPHFISSQHPTGILSIHLDLPVHLPFLTCLFHKPVGSLRAAFMYNPL